MPRENRALREPRLRRGVSAPRWTSEDMTTQRLSMLETAAATGALRRAARA
jgi:hypothetical protein